MLHQIKSLNFIGILIVDYINQKGKADGREKSSIYHSEIVEPCYFSSSIYYGGQEVYSPTGQNTNSQHIVSISPLFL